MESDESDDDEYKPPVKKGIKVSSPVESSSSKKKKQVGSKQKHAKPASKSPKKPQSNNVGSPSKLQPKVTHRSYIMHVLSKYIGFWLPTGRIWQESEIYSFGESIY